MTATYVRVVLLESAIIAGLVILGSDFLLVGMRSLDWAVVVAYVAWIVYDGLRRSKGTDKVEGYFSATDRCRGGRSACP